MERTTEGGLDLLKKPAPIRRAMNILKNKGAEVSLFIDPDRRQVEAAQELGADSIELHTGDYANTEGGRARQELERLKKASTEARAASLNVYAGHGLDYRNTQAVCRIPEMQELNIGYSIVSRALWVGFEQAVREMLTLIRKAR